MAVFLLTEAQENKLDRTRKAANGLAMLFYGADRMTLKPDECGALLDMLAEGIPTELEFKPDQQPTLP